MLSGPHALRWIALVAVAAIGVHRLRYAAGYGVGSGEALDRHGHAYMWIVLAASTVALCMAAAGVAVALARVARSDGRPEPPAPALPALWARSAAVLAALYVMQESLEGLLAPAHPGGLAGVLGHGGWSALVFSALLGAAVALFVRGTSTLVARVGRRSQPPRPRRSGAPTPRPPRPPLPRRAPLASRMAGRAPPTVSH